MTEFKRPADAVQFVVLTTAELLPLIHDKIQKHLSEGTITSEMLKNFYILNTTHSLLITHSAAIGYLVPRIERRLNVKSEKIKTIIEEFNDSMSKAKTASESIIATLKPFHAEINLKNDKKSTGVKNLNDVIDLIKDAIAKMKTPKLPKPTKNVKVGSGDHSRTLVVGGATSYRLRDKKLARKHGNDDTTDLFMVNEGESLKDLINLPPNDYFQRMIKQYKLDSPVKSQIELSKTDLDKIKNSMEDLEKLYKKTKKKYEQSYIPGDFKKPKMPKVKLSSKDLTVIPHVHKYINDMRQEIMRMLAYIAVDKNNRDGAVVELEPVSYPMLKMADEFPSITMPEIPDVSVKKPECGCPKDHLIAVEEALEPYSDSVEMAYGDLAEKLGKVFSDYRDYNPNDDYKKLKKYATSCASRLKPGEDVETYL